MGTFTKDRLINEWEDVSQWVVLIVDDEPDNLKVANTILSFKGATVHIAENGVQGLEVMQQVDPLFILLDISMPQMNGWDMIKAIRDMPDYAEIPVIALTAHAMAGDKERAMAEGFDGYITKPFRMATFLDLIFECLDRVQTRFAAE